MEEGGEAMRRVWILALALIFTLAAVCQAEEWEDINFAALTQGELEGLAADVDLAIERYHGMDLTTGGEMLLEARQAVESYFSRQGIDVSWAWVDYSFARDWNLYTLETHVDYRDAAGVKRKPSVHAELLRENGGLELYFLRVGEEEVIDRRDELPDEPWSQQPEQIVNATTGLELSTLRKDELESLKSRAQAEIEASHGISSTMKEFVRALVKLEVERHFAAEDVEASFAWFDYYYTSDWELYTLRTPVDLQDAAGRRREEPMLAEVYPLSGQYGLCYLTVGDEVLIDRRDELPGEMRIVEEKARAAGIQRSKMGNLLSEAESSAKSGIHSAKDALSEQIDKLRDKAGQWLQSDDFPKFGGLF